MEKERLYYADVLRTAAIIAVVFVHVSGAWLTEDIIGTDASSIMNIYSLLSKWCVPIFVMLSGMFMLDLKKKITIKDIYLRYILRVFIALIVWGAFYAHFDLGYGFSISLSSITDSFIHALSADTHYHLWFLYLMIGLYVLTPILRSFIKGAKAKERLYLISISLMIGTIIPTIEAIFKDDTLLRWISMTHLDTLTSYIGLYVLGYHLKVTELNKRYRNIIYISAICMTVIALIIEESFAAKLHLLNIPYIFNNLSLNNIMVATSIFIFAKDRRYKKSKLITAISLSSFGMYLVHDYLINILYSLGVSAIEGTIYMIPLLSIAIVIISFIISYIITKIPYIGHYLA